MYSSCAGLVYRMVFELQRGIKSMRVAFNAKLGATNDYQIVFCYHAGDSALRYVEHTS